MDKFVTKLATVIVFKGPLAQITGVMAHRFVGVIIVLCLVLSAMAHRAMRPKIAASSLGLAHFVGR